MDKEEIRLLVLMFLITLAMLIVTRFFGISDILNLVFLTILIVLAHFDIEFVIRLIKFTK